MDESTPLWAENPFSEKNLVYSDLDTWVYYKKKWDWKKEVELNLGSHLNYRCCERYDSNKQELKSTSV